MCLYTLDGDGNRSSVKVTPYGQSASTTSYTDNALNQYTAQYAAVGPTNRSHDKNGNLTDDGTYDFEYDYRNQIVRVKEDTTTIAEYKYDALGRRVEKDDQTDVERYVYSGAETIAVYDGSDNLVREFVFGQVIDEVLMMQQADVLDFDSDSNTTELTRSFYHSNALGSVMEITDMNEAVAVSYRYNPYGAATITRNSQEQSSDPLGNPWMYTSRFHYEETGLEYYRARYYSTETGRFLQRDPLGYMAGPSLYAYVRSQPINARDPFGLEDSSPFGSDDYAVQPAPGSYFGEEAPYWPNDVPSRDGGVTEPLHQALPVASGSMSAGVDSSGKWMKTYVSWQVSASGVMKCPDGEGNRWRRVESGGYTFAECERVSMCTLYSWHVEFIQHRQSFMERPGELKWESKDIMSSISAAVDWLKETAGLDGKGVPSPQDMLPSPRQMLSLGAAQAAHFPELKMMFGKWESWPDWYMFSDYKAWVLKGRRVPCDESDASQGSSPDCAACAAGELPPSAPTPKGWNRDIDEHDGFPSERIGVDFSK